MTQHVQKQIDDIQREVEGLAFSAFGQREALALGKVLLTLAEQRSLRIALGVDLGQQILFRAGLPGTNADYQTWIDRKFAVVRRFAKASLELELRARIETQFASERALDPAHYALCGGAVPILIGSTMVGSVGCAGLASIDDHKLVVEALRGCHKQIDHR